MTGFWIFLGCLAVFLLASHHLTKQPLAPLEKDSGVDAHAIAKSFRWEEWEEKNEHVSDDSGFVAFTRGDVCLRLFVTRGAAKFERLSVNHIDLNVPKSKRRIIMAGVRAKFAAKAPSALFLA